MIFQKVLRFKEIDSTQTRARRLISEGEGEGLVVVAEAQTRGRGKPGSRWFSPKGNLYLSAVVKPRKNPSDLAPITLLAALAARSAIAQAAKLSPVIKWPNDLLVGGKKICGVLVERIPSGHLIIGIGININGRIPAGATSLKIETGKTFSIGRIEKSLISELDGEYRRFLN